MGTPVWAAAAELPAELRRPLAAEEALIEADRCLDCGGLSAPAPCVTACPAGVDVPSFIRSIAAGDVDGAARTIFEDNLLGATCARVCPVEVLCQGACVLEHGGRPPIAIGALQRFATERALARGLPPRERAATNGLAVAVVGAGPAGLVCAGELAARGYSVTIYDERAEVGGLVRYAIAPYRQESDPLPAEQRALEALGVRFRLGTTISGPGDLARIAANADAVFLGVGMGADADVRYPGDELPGVWDSLPFIEALKTGSPPDVGERVVVVGGGNTAIDVCRESLRLGAEQVTLVYRRTRAEMPAYAFEVDEAEREGVRFQWLASPLRFVGDWHLEGLECGQMTLGEADAGGRRRPLAVADSAFVLPADTAVKAIGQRPREELAAWIEGVTFENSLLKIDADSGQTDNPKFFAGGDVANGGASVVEAVAAAKRAAKGIDTWLQRR